MRRRGHIRRGIDVRLQAIGLMVLTIVSAVLNFSSSEAFQIHTTRNIVFSGLFGSQFIIHPGAGSILLGIAAIVLTCLSLYVVAGRLIQDNMDVVVVPFLYAFLCSFSPYLLYFNQFHIVTLLCIWSLYLVVSFRMDEHNFPKLFFSLILTSIASLIYTPVIWFGVIIFLINIGTDIDKLRYLLMTVSALLAPYLFLSGTVYLFNDFESVLHTAEDFSLSLFDFKPFDLRGRTADIICLGALTFIGLAGGLGVLVHHDRFKIVTERAYRRILAEFIGIAALILLYSTEIPSGIELLLLMPVSLLAIDLFNLKIRRTTSVILQIIVIAAIILSKLSLMGQMPFNF